MLFDFLIERLGDLCDIKSIKEFNDLIVFFYVGLEDVILEESKLLEAIWENHEADAVLHTLKPITAIYEAIDPVHLTIALAFIVFKGALIGISALPEELAIAVLLVSLIFTFEAILDAHLLVSAHIHIFLWFLAPFTLPMFHPVKEFTCVCITI